MHVSGAGFAESRPDTPPGRLDFAHSAATGRTLAYFTPDPLSQLLDRYARKGSITTTTTDEGEERALILLFSLASASHDATGCVDAAQAKRLTDSSFGRLVCPDSRAAIALAKEISPRVQGLRSEVVFAGARNASAAVHVFAPHEAVSRQFEGFINAARCPPHGAHPSDVAAITAFCGIHLHPFLDGNGRWSRLIAAQAAATAGSGASGAIAAAFQLQCKTLLTKFIWPQARASGLSRYLAISSAFERYVRKTLRTTSTHEIITRLLNLIDKYAPNKRSADKAALVLLTADNPDVPNALCSSLSLSQKRFTGFIDHLHTLGSDFGAHNGSIVAALTSGARECLNGARVLIQKELQDNGR